MKLDYVGSVFFFFFKQKTAYEIVSRDWSSDVCSSDLCHYTLSSNVWNFFTEKRRQLARLVEIARQKERLQVDLLRRSFERSENQLTVALNQRKKEVKVGITH